MGRLRTEIKTYTVNELVEALRNAARNSPWGGETPVCIEDWEGNMSAFGFVETLEVKYDPDTSRIGIYCDPHEGCMTGWGEPAKPIR